MACRRRSRPPLLVECLRSLVPEAAGMPRQHLRSVPRRVLGHESVLGREGAHPGRFCQVPGRLGMAVDAVADEPASVDAHFCAIGRCFHWDTPQPANAIDVHLAVGDIFWCLRLNREFLDDGPHARKAHLWVGAQSITVRLIMRTPCVGLVLASWRLNVGDRRRGGSRRGSSLRRRRRQLSDALSDNAQGRIRPPRPSADDLESAAIRQGAPLDHRLYPDPRIRHARPPTTCR